MPPAGLLLPLAEQNIASQIQRLGDARQPGLADDASPQLGEFALRGIRMAVVQMVAHDQTQDRVAQQLQPLVTLAAAAAPAALRPMLQRHTEQPAVAQPPVELALQLPELRPPGRVARWKR